MAIAMEDGRVVLWTDATYMAVFVTMFSEGIKETPSARELKYVRWTPSLSFGAGMVTVKVRCKDKASPRTSKPGPIFAADAGTLIVMRVIAEREVIWFRIGEGRAFSIWPF
jgi:hypothetical protein